jgi:putative salt-induced outer membrane protein YdiY
VESITDKVSFALADIKSINPAPAVIESAMKVKVRFNLGSTSAKGNTESESQHFDGEFVARSEKNRYTLGAELNRAEDDSEQTVNNSIGYIKYDHFLTERWFIYSNALFEKDRFKDLNLRSALGLGGGYQILESPSVNLSGEAGFTYINEDFYNATDEGYSAGRWAINFDKYFLENFIQLFHFHEGFLRVDDTNDLLIRSRTGLRVPIYKAFNATFQINYDWDKRPSPGLKKADRMYIMTIGYQIDK